MLELRDLSFAYPAGRPLLEGLSFTFRSGGICAVLGPNGTGKTTLLKLLLGILKPSSGEMLLSGMPIGRMTRPEACPQARLYPAGCVPAFSAQCI